MENNLDLKQELQQDLRDLQQDIANHSTFNNEVWRRSVKRSSQHLYLKNLTYSVILAIITLVFTLFLTVGGEWPWWFILLFDLLMGYIIVKSLILTHGMKRPDVHSQTGLMSLRESVRKSSSKLPLRERIPFVVVCIAWLVLFTIILSKKEPDMLMPVLIASLVSIPTGLLAGQKVKKSYSNLNEEIDELLKEE